LARLGAQPPAGLATTVVTGGGNQVGVVRAVGELTAIPQPWM
jgi:hypothetical protein